MFSHGDPPPLRSRIQWSSFPVHGAPQLQRFPRRFLPLKLTTQIFLTSTYHHKLRMLLVKSRILRPSPETPSPSPLPQPLNSSWNASCPNRLVIYSNLCQLFVSVLDLCEITNKQIVGFVLKALSFMGIALSLLPQNHKIVTFQYVKFSLFIFTLIFTEFTLLMITVIASYQFFIVNVEIKFW